MHDLQKISEYFTDQDQDNVLPGDSIWEWLFGNGGFMQRALR